MNIENYHPDYPQTRPHFYRKALPKKSEGERREAAIKLLVRVRIRGIGVTILRGLVELLEF